MATKLKTTPVAVLLVQGDFEVHKADCQAMKQVMPKVSNYFTHDVTKGDTQFDVIADLWDDQIAESVGEGNHYATVEDAVHASYQYATKFHDCVKGIIDPMPAYKAPTESHGAKGPDLNPPKRTRKRPAKKPISKETAAKLRARKADREHESYYENGSRLSREQKTQLATAVVAQAAKLVGGNISLQIDDVDPAVVAKTIAQWLHHLPVDRAAWPSELPKPNRSDWR